MSNMPLISIITPTYNHADYIRKCIESVIEQDYLNWEQIIIDDGSTDDTPNIISEFDDERIIYIKQDNIGIQNLNKTYNKALNLSKGEYIAILEGDDYWPDYKLGEQIKILKKMNVILSCGNAQIIDDEDNDEDVTHKPKSLPEISSTYETLDELLLENFITACTVICNKKALLRIGGFQQSTNSPCVDYSTWLQLSKLGDFNYNDKILGYWRHHKGQASSRNTLNMIKSHMDYGINFYNSLPTHERELLSINLQNIIKSQNNYLMEIYFLLGRKSLHQKEWVKSRKYFKKSLNGSNITKFYSSICIFCSFLKIDFEKLISILNKTHINDLISD